MESVASTIKFLTDPEFQVSSGSGYYQTLPFMREDIEGWWDFSLISGEPSWPSQTIVVNITEPLYYISESEARVLQRSLLRSATIIDAGRLLD